MIRQLHGSYQSWFLASLARELALDAGPERDVHWETGMESTRLFGAAGKPWIFDSGVSPQSEFFRGRKMACAR
jgi:hypothetical protein